MLKKVKFKCHKCSGTILEEVMSGITQSSSITDIDPLNGAYPCVEYGYVSTTDGELDRYQCSACGYVLTDEPKGSDIKGVRIIDPVELLRWLNEHDQLGE